MVYVTSFITYSVTKFDRHPILSLRMLFVSLRLNLHFLARESVFNASVEVKWVLVLKLDDQRL